MTRFDDLSGARVPPDDLPDPADADLALVDGFRPTDQGNALRLIRLADSRIRYVHRWGKWIVYEDGRWILDFKEALIGALAADVPRGLFTVAADLDEKIRDVHRRWAKTSESSGAATAMINLARSSPAVLVQHGELDRKPWLLNVLNGTIDLRTGGLSPHNPDDLLTVQAPVIYDPAATAPLWSDCLERWQPDPDIRTFLQRACGTAISGHPLEHLFVNHGTGSNGKTKFFEAIKHVLGDYAVTPSKGLFVVTKHEDHKTELASLFGARMIVLPETAQAGRLNEDSVKNLTGGDAITCRRMREDEWTFQPTHTAFMHTNYKPRITGTDLGIWRRIRLIPWTTTIDDAEKDDALGEKLQGEAAGILAWLVAGCLDWQRTGLAEPDSVIAATAAYRSGEDHVGRFLADCLVVKPTGAIRSKRLRELYVAWCDDTGEEEWNAQRLGRALTDRGFDSGKVGSDAYRIGLEEP